jgi:energy-coupling factor transporter transmembrane protein EcfT
MIVRSAEAGLHGATPAANLFLLAGLVGVVMASPSVAVRLGALGAVLLLAGWSGVPVGPFLRGLRFVLVFAAVLFVAQALSIREGTPLIDGFSRFTDVGLLAGAGMALRFLVVLSSSLLFVHVVDPDRLAGALIRCGIPYRYGYLLILSLRFVPFFRRELRVVREAQRVRGLRPSVRSLRGIRQAIRYTFIPVLVSGLMRVDSIALSMKGRCFGLYRRRTAPRRERLRAADGVALGSVALLAVLAVLAARGGWT